MITHTNTRWQGMPSSRIPWGDPIVSQRTVIDCAVALARYELGYGGQPTDFSRTRLVVHTPVMGGTDEVTLEGSEEEMRTILELVATWAEVNGTRMTDQDAERVVNTFGGNPLLITSGGFMLIGQGRWRTFVAAVIAEQEEHLRTLVTLNDDTLEAALELRLEGFSTEDILEAVA